MASPSRSVNSPGSNVPKMPLEVLALRSPRSPVRSKSPRSSPASPEAPFFTAFTAEGRSEPEAKGIRIPVSESVIPWPRAPKEPVSGS